MNNNSQNLNINISVNTILRLVLIGFLVFAAIKLISLLLIVLTAIVIASFVESAVLKSRRFIKNRVLAVVLIYLIVTGIIVGLAYVFLPVFVNEMSDLVDFLGQYIPEGSILNTFQENTLSGAKNVVSTISSNASLGDLMNSIQKLTNNLSGNFFDVFGRAFGGVINLGLIFIISFYLSVKEKGIEGFLRIITPAKSEEYIIHLWQRTQHKIGLWIQGQLLLGLIMGLLAYLGLTILGVKYSLLLAISVVIFELIPYGIYVAVIPAVIFSYLDGGITTAVLAGLLYLILHQFEAYLIYPLIIKKVIGIPPLVVILSLIVGWTLASFWGVILAVPVAVCLFEFLGDLEKKKILARDG